MGTDPWMLIQPTVRAKQRHIKHLSIFTPLINVAVGWQATFMEKDKNNYKLWNPACSKATLHWVEDADADTRSAVYETSEAFCLGLLETRCWNGWAFQSAPQTTSCILKFLRNWSCYQHRFCMGSTGFLTLLANNWASRAAEGEEGAAKGTHFLRAQLIPWPREAMLSYTLPPELFSNFCP